MNEKIEPLENKSDGLPKGAKSMRATLVPAVDGRFKYLLVSSLPKYCPFQPGEVHCGTWCALFEEANTERETLVKLHCVAQPMAIVVSY